MWGVIQCIFSDWGQYFGLWYLWKYPTFEFFECVCFSWGTRWSSEMNVVPTFVPPTLVRVAVWLSCPQGARSSLGSVFMVRSNGERPAAPMDLEKLTKWSWTRPNLPGWSWNTPVPENIHPEKDSSLAILLSQVWTKGCHPHQWWGMIR